jgi:radical SAM superfamily enzyme YgiQ (UPF0313 family)
MKISFVNPPSIPRYNIGLAYAITAVGLSSHEPKLIDLAFAPKKYLKHIIWKIKQQKPDIIGFSTITATQQKSLYIARIIKEEFPDLPLIWGGVHPTLLPEQTIQHPLVDAICIGEGEQTIPAYLDKLEAGRPPRVRGIWYKRGGKIIKNPPRPWIRNLDSLPFPNWDYWKLENYFRTSPYFPGVLPVLASRGCPFNCSFCSNLALRQSVPGKYHRERSPENVIEEVRKNGEKYLKRGLRGILFEDEIFFLGRKKFRLFTKLYVKEHLNEELPWICSSRPELIDREWVDCAKRAGCVAVNLGLESYDEMFRNKIYKKRFTNRQFKDAITKLREGGIAYTINLIIGAPYETKELVKKNIRCAEALNPLFLHINPYIPLPKTELGEVCGKNKWVRKTSAGVGIETPHLELRDVMSIYHHSKIRRMGRLFARGINEQGLNYIFKLMKYILNFNRVRITCLFEPITQLILSEYPIFSHQLERWKDEKSFAY